VIFFEIFQKYFTEIFQGKKLKFYITR